jgi:hypothetical protein
MVSYIRARSEGLGIKCEVGVFTRTERVIVLAVGLIISHWISKAVPVTLGILATLAFVTVIQRLFHTQQLKRERPTI